MDEVIFQNKPNLYAFCLFVLLFGFKKINQMRLSKGYVFKQHNTPPPFCLNGFLWFSHRKCKQPQSRSFKCSLGERAVSQHTAAASHSP